MIESASTLTQCFRLLLQKSVRKSTLFMLSNIAADNTTHKQAIITNSTIWKKVIEMAIHSAWEVKMEALWVVTNLITKGNDKQVHMVGSCGGIEALCNYIKAPRDLTVLQNVLDAIEKTLQLDQKVPSHPFFETFWQYDLPDHLEELLNHTDKKVYDVAVYILTTYFKLDDDDEEDQNIAPPAVANDSAFAFGAPKELFPDCRSPKIRFDFGDCTNMEH